MHKTKKKKSEKVGPNLNQLLNWIPDVRVNTDTNTPSLSVNNMTISFVTSGGAASEQRPPLDSTAVHFFYSALSSFFLW